LLLKLKRTQPLEHDSDLEQVFDSLVEQLGGIRVSDTYEDQSRLPINPDYYFPKQNCAIELKQLGGEFDHFSVKQKLNNYIGDHEFVEDSDLNLFDKIYAVQSAAKSKVITKFKRYLEKRISTAIKQLRAFRKEKSDGSMKLVILLVNQSVSGISDEDLMESIHAIAKKYYARDLSGLIYCSGNIDIVLPDNSTSAYWQPEYSSQESLDCLEPLIQSLGNLWLDTRKPMGVAAPRLDRSYNENRLKMKKAIMMSENESKHSKD
jgi:hypothetical protein